MKKLKNDLEINIEEIKELYLSLPKETPIFIKECLEKRGKVLITEISETCLSYLESFGICSLTSDNFIREYSEEIGYYALNYNKKIFEELFAYLESKKSS
ncbi:hypothetical protein [Cetobacterium somerae]